MRVRSLLLPTLSVLGLLLVLSGCAAQSDPHGNEQLRDWMSRLDNAGQDLTYEQHMAMGRALVENGQAEQAVWHAAKALRLRPDDIQALLLEADALRRSNEPQKAMEAIKAVLAKAPENPAANLEAGRIYFAAGLPDKAEGFLEKAAAIPGPQEFEAHLLLGAVLDSREDYQNAVAQYEKALSLRPGDLDALNNLGVARMMLGQYAQAVDIFGRAVRSGGTKPRTCNNLGLALARLGRNDDALQAFRCAGSEAQAHNNLGYVLFLEGDYAGAMYHLQKALEISPVFYPQASENLKRVRLAAAHATQPAAAPAVPSVPAAAPEVPLAVSPAAAQPAVNPAVRQAVHPAARPAAHPAIQPTAAPVAVPATEPAAKPDGAQGTGPVSSAAPVAPQKTVAAKTTHAAQIAQAASVQNRQAAAPKVVLAAQGEARGWGLLVSSWKSEEHALAHVSKLESKGIPAAIETADLGDRGTWYRVVWGNFASVREALAAKSSPPQGLDLSDSCAVPLHSDVNSATSRMAASL
ncbi:Sporulation domain-containing protein [Desulfovibrio sp. X2]|uniref:SPOR domain-containing protein n=1 Tax=Desulfovibrio sp. X2 TaxID=941449 RepID=UPI000358B07B|nr:tetratricopeptide repeat protein [Desulfovibrio sp. X2]EPR44142.1 Sporulation domain-containing protein [Desulfovibrio sp. X2]